MGNYRRLARPSLLPTVGGYMKGELLTVVLPSRGDEAMLDNIRIHAVSKSLSFFFACSMAIFVLTTAVLSQKTENTDHKADQNVKLSARVNPISLAMEFSFPLISYPGRDGNSTPISLNYSSKVWKIKLMNVQTESGQTGNPAVPYYYKQSFDIGGIYSERSIAGWTSSLQPPRILDEWDAYDANGDLYPISFQGLQGGGQGWAEDYCIFLRTDTFFDSHCYGGFGLQSVYYCCPPDDYCYDYSEEVGCAFGPGPGGSPTPTPPPGPTPTPAIPHTVKRVNVAMSDGRTVEFRKGDNVNDCSTQTDCYVNDQGTYLAVDGSGMRLERSELQPNQEHRDVLYLPNGSKYIFQALTNTARSPLAEKFVDSNGNTSVFRESDHTWVDTVGRDIKDDFPNPLNISGLTVGTQDLKVKGINGADVTYKAEWKKLENSFENTSTQTHYAGNDTCQGVNGSPLAPSLFAGDVSHETTIPNTDVTTTRRICNGFGSTSTFNPIVLTALIQPDGEKIEFKYNEYGEITKIIYPAGGYETFEYGYIPPVGMSADEVYAQGNRGVKKHIIFDGTASTEWDYAQFYESAKYGIRVTAPDQTVTERILFQSSGSSFGFDDPRSGMVIEERSKDSVNGEWRSRVLNDWIVLGSQGTNGSQGAMRDPRLKRSVRFIFEPNSTSALATLSETDYETPGENSSTAPTDPTYFAHLNAIRQRNYGYVAKDLTTAKTETNWQTIEGWFPASTLATATETDYSYDSNYRAHGIIGLPKETRLMNPLNLAWPALSTSQTIYDNALPAADSYYTYAIQNYSGLGSSLNCGDSQNQKICWQNPNGTATPDLSYRGLPTTTRIWYAEGNNLNGIWIESHVQYDQFGNPVKKKDPIGNEATTAFDSQYKYAYPTSVTTPAPDPQNTGHGTNLTSTASTSYDFTTGLPLSVTDDFGQVTTTDYDAYLRPIRVNPVVISGSPTGPKTETVYGTPDQTTGQFDANNRFVKVRKQLDANNWDESTTWFDGLGRTIKTQAKDSQGDVFVDTHYDTITGRVDRVTNPYRTGDTVYWSKTRYDLAGRAVETYAPTIESNLANAQSLGTTSFDISTVNDSSGNFIGTVVTTNDASGRKSRSITNALGQLIRVDEATATGGTETNDLGSLASPNQKTVYTYDIFGKMVMVTQGVQKRYFKYDSLGRLIRVKQPEQDPNPNLTMSDAYNTLWQWSAGFTYDILGNVLTATDANGVTITNTYDKASRVITRSYSGEPSGQTTPTVQFFYDGQGLDSIQSPNNFAKGKLTKVDNGISRTRYTLFDNFGRLTATEQKTPLDGQTMNDATPYVTQYTYNLSGALVQETYPSGRVVKNEFESDGDLQDVVSKKAGGTVFTPYVSNFSYTASGGISQMKLGNGKWETAKFNERLQVYELGLGGGPADASLWKVHYDYGELSQDGASVDAAKNTGNIARQILTVPGTSFTQTYRYDSLYRLTEAKEPSGTSTPNWIQNWNYDRYGNRNSFTQNIAGNSNVLNPTIDPNTNRFTSTDFVYDKNGNVTSDKDPVANLTRTFVFNGDNKQTAVKDSNGNNVGQYFYDGEGKRVKKVTNTETTIFVYSSGKLVAEYSTQLAANPSINYTTTDHLGSPRIITNELGQVKSRRDFMPFGEEIDASVGNRSNAGLQYSVSGDLVRQKFTGYQKDSETSLDFAEARMYENRFGRFTAVDPLLASGKSANPQSFNRYTYVVNNPLAHFDPDGSNPVYFKWTVRQGVKVRDFSTDSRKANATGWERYEGDPVLVYGRYNGSKRSTYRIVQSDGIYSAKSRTLEDIARSRLPGKASMADPKVTALVDSVSKNPLFKSLEKVTNPDGITFNVQQPYGGGGGSLTFTKNFDVVASGNFGISASDMQKMFDGGSYKDFFKPPNVFGLFSVQASYITEMDVTRKDRLSFYTGQSFTTNACVYLCGGVTVAGPPEAPRSAINVGLTRGASYGNMNLGPGVYLFNLHEVFGMPVPDNEARYTQPRDER
jgi:RHS repeat-associated protein